ncbi:MAG: sigma-54-dependent Fis family transcriptional regulator [Proteobacteria bacterium]|nr:sigma-54-dependent Fis family transcriptional regulator [Pseudomonadota bacterium]
MNRNINEKQLAAWRGFVERGTIDAAQVRPEVAVSWRRCAAAGVDPYAPKAPVKLTAAELKAVRRRNQEFIDAALPFMHFLETAVRGSGFILVLTDRQSIVLEVFGDEKILAMARENNYVPGCSRTELEVGTNAICLALQEQKSVQLTGPEHYNVRHQSWTCSSSPVFSSTGEPLGTVTLSGESIGAHRHTFGMVVAAAEAIQNHLREREAETKKTKSEIMLTSILMSVSEAIIALDQEGGISNVNPVAARLLAIKPDEVVGKNIAALFPGTPDIFRNIQESRNATPVEATIDAQKGRGNFIVTPYHTQTGTSFQGAILVVAERRKFIHSVRELSGLNAFYTFDHLIGSAPVFVRQIELARIAARQDSRILITGETGTGKELLAQAIHNGSARSSGPFVAINCAAIPRDLLESEILGYKDGAFSGARKGGQVGKLELADGGTIFLDEISQMPMDMQVKLLRVLQDGIITRLGDTKPMRIDVRVIAATNEDLYEKSRAGGFRQDLYFRLSVVEIGLPPLRDRAEDIPVLARHFMGRLAGNAAGKAVAISASAMSVLCGYGWLGNIRELENVLEMAAIVCGQGTIEPQHLGQRIQPLSKTSKEAATRPTKMKEVEIDVLRATMQELQGNIALVSRNLGISRSTIYRRMREHGISRSVHIG